MSAAVRLPGVEWTATAVKLLQGRCSRLHAVKPKLHYADFPVTSAISPRQTRDVPFSPNSITPTSPKLSRPGSFGEVGVMEFGLNSATAAAAADSQSIDDGTGQSIVGTANELLTAS